MRYLDIISELEKGHRVELKPKGNSMTPLIRSGQRIQLAPIDGVEIKKNDIVLAKVNGKFYIHLVTAIGEDGRYQISNNHGRVNGWARKIYGIVTEIY